MWTELKTEVVVTVGGLFGIGANALGMITGQVSFIDDFHALGMSLLSGAAGIAGAYGMQTLIKWFKVRRDANKAKRITRNSTSHGPKEGGDIYSNSK